MTNYEKYIKGNDELLKQIVYREYKVAVDRDGNLKNCYGMSCNNCQFEDDSASCDECRNRWLDKTVGIEVGDIVVITNPGRQYTQYIDWVVEHVEDKSLAVSYRLEDELYKGDKYRVLAKAQHGTCAIMLYYIQSVNSDNKTCYLIGEEGIEPAK